MPYSLQAVKPMMPKEALISVKMWTESQITDLRVGLLDWYDRMGRTLPWRVRPEDRARGVVPDPYAVWLSEIMLQQTTVPHATPYWEKFLAAFPTVTDLANADREQVMAMWAGLGYYARARNLYKCAQIIRDDHGGIFPGTEAALLKLPGIGPYTAAAIAGICFDEATVVVDGNVERVISRMARVDAPLPRGKKDIKSVAAQVADVKRSGDYSQALMDLGATVCTPRNPKCGICVWDGMCAAHAGGVEEDYPKKLKKKPLPKRFGAAFVLRSYDGYVLLRQRPDQGLLGGMLEFPGTEWGVALPESVEDFAPIKTHWQKQKLQVRHVFTHFELTLDVYTASLDNRTALNTLKSSPNAEKIKIVSEHSLDSEALPSVMVKVLRVAIPN
ncbi:MAG: A/G-specific adenine glycosylase [Maricaulaceae bacterium]